jgi:hypothetical protein
VLVVLRPLRLLMDGWMDKPLSARLEASDLVAQLL